MAKKGSSKIIQTIDECVSNGVKNGIFQVSLEDHTLDGREVTINGKRVINFGSCSYLGLEVDERLKQGAIDATMRYGTQYSSSRAYSACNLYEELEDLFHQIFDHNSVVLSATTTLTHVAAMPILVQEDDLVILDHQVHGSVQLAAQLVKARGTRVEMIRHNRMDMLEDLIRENPNKYNKIWYMADGLYSMYGDYVPLKEVTYLMEKYSTFHVYIDDAHGMSWTGKHGAGYILSQMPLHPKMVLTTSLAKGFGTGGGLTVLSDKEMLRTIKSCGSSYTFSGPVQPPMLGASIASAKIHLTDEIYELQNKLKSKIKLAQSIIEEHALPSILGSDSPIFYLGLGLPRVGYNMVKRLLNEGFYTNIGIFPAAPVNCTGLRLPITNGQTDDDIRNLLDAVKYHFPLVLEEEGMTIDKIAHSFKVPLEETKKRYSVEVNPFTEVFDVQHETTIRKIDKTVWDNLLGDGGTFDWEGCRFIEETFSNNPEPENNWKLHYLIIRDQHKNPVLATYFTELLCKDDMIAPADASKRIEEIRLKDKYYLTSTVVMMGSMLSLGDHLYLNRKHPKWQNAVKAMLQIMNEVKQQCGASALQLRDLSSNDQEMRDFLIKEGFIKVEMPDIHTMNNMKWKDEQEYLSRFSSNSRWNFRKLILDKKSNFNTQILTSTGEKAKGNADDWFRLYSNVKNKSFSINTFTIPVKFFTNLVNHPGWEVIELRLRAGETVPADKEGLLVAVNFCYRSSKNAYSLYAVGLDYDYVVEHGCYRQSLYHSMNRAHDLGSERFYLGMDATVEKKRFGATPVQVSAYVQTNDNYNMELIGVMQNNAA